MQRIANHLSKIVRSCDHKRVSNGIAFCGDQAYHTCTNRRLEGKVAVVTGGAKGIGEATCRLFVAQGAKVVIADVDEEAGRRVAADLNGSAVFQRCDVSKEDDVASTVAFAMSQHGSLDVMFNNAGISHLPSAFTEIDMSEFTRVLETNVKGVVHGVKHAAQVMKSGSSIICTGSVNSVVALGGSHAYTISKHAVAGVIRSAAMELGSRGIRVNGISPWVVPTPMVEKTLGQLVGASAEQVARLAHRPDNVPLQGVGHLNVHDVAFAALFLASNESRFVNGQNLLLDGGFTSSRHFCFSLDPPN